LQQLLGNSESKWTCSSWLVVFRNLESEFSIWVDVDSDRHSCFWHALLTRSFEEDNNTYETLSYIFKLCIFVSATFE
jgi:hypothetical protein